MISIHLWTNFALFIVCGIAGVIFYLIKKKTKKIQKFENVLKDILINSVKTSEKVSRISANKGVAEKFGINDLVCNMLDVGYMLQELKESEFEYVDKAFKILNDKYEDKYLNFDNYNKLYREIAIDFDMVIPYYKICKEGCPVVRYNDIGKDEYREKARKLLDNGLMLSRQWFELKNDFYNTFYAVYDE